MTEGEIIFFFFTDHVHFEDYSSEWEEGTPDYVERAMVFIDMLFTLPIEQKYTTKGDKITRDETLSVLPTGEKESCAGVMYTFSGFKNTFKKAIEHTEMKQFDGAIGNFLSRPL